MRVAALVVATALVLPACGGGGDEADGAAPAAPSASADGGTSTTAVGPASTTGPAPTTAPPTTAAPLWVVGAQPLPLRADGFGEVLPTPDVLVDRRLPTIDLMPPPASGGFESAVAPISDEVRARMGTTLAEGCPVGLDELRHLTMSFRGFDGGAHTGEMVVHASVADDVVSVFRTLFDADFPIEEMRLVTTADLDAAPTGDGNNTASFVCRAVRGGTRFSAHASGLAVDVNPFHNPYVRDDLVLPELASAYVDRAAVRPGMIVDGDVVVQAFEAIGWTWGGDFTSLTDTMHFSATGG